jgi:predicted DNA-binding protein
MSERMVQKTFTIEEGKLERLKALSAKTRVPVSVYIREALDRVLDLAEKQQRMTEQAAANAEQERG